MPQNFKLNRSISTKIKDATIYGTRQISLIVEPKQNRIQTNASFDGMAQGY
jgi:hypothetical protein